MELFAKIFNGWTFFCKTPSQLLERVLNTPLVLWPIPVKMMNRGWTKKMFPKRSIIQKQPPRGVPRKRCSENMQQIYRRKLLKQLYWNHTSAWLLSCKFAAYFQNSFSGEHLWVTASGSFMPRLSETLNRLLGVGLKNFSMNFKKPHTILIYECPDLYYSILWLCTERKSSQNILSARHF